MHDTEASPPAGERRRFPGPRRAGEAPVGPDAVREAVLEAAAALFARSGVERVSLRDVAKAANVKVTLIGRYIGTRQELIDAVFRRVNDAVTADLVERPLERQPTGPDSSVGRWLALLTYYSSAGASPPTDGPNPVRVLADIFEERFGLDTHTARLRAAQVAAVALGWRLFEDYFVESAEVDDLDRDTLRADLNAIQRIVGSTPWPTPPLD